MAVDFPKDPGTYGLIFSRPAAGWIQVGKLGRFEFPAGFYVYVGSALGPGGLAGRLGRHLSQEKRTHWHVDYLSREVTLVEIWYAPGEEIREHDWAAAAGRLPGARIAAAGFGASDCRCPAHLFHFMERPVMVHFVPLLAEQGVAARPVQVILIAA